MGFPASKNLKQSLPFVGGNFFDASVLISYYYPHDSPYAIVQSILAVTVVPKSNT